MQYKNQPTGSAKINLFSIITLFYTTNVYLGTKKEPTFTSRQNREKILSEQKGS